MTEKDVHFYFDPVCPFAYMTSKWLRMVTAQRRYTVDWRFISLRLINSHLDYDSHFPPEYEAGHTAGLRLLRVLARARSTYGRDVIGPLYAALGRHIFDTESPTGKDLVTAGVDHRGAPSFVTPILTEVGLPSTLVEALEDDSLDLDIRAESEEALSLTGKDVGTPIIHFDPPEGVAFFGPVISRLPDEEQAAQLWDHVLGLARFRGFAELKRSLRELPQLAALGVSTEDVGAEQDWHAGSRRLKK